MALLGFPLLLIPFAVYNILAFILRMGDGIWTTTAATINLPSLASWTMTWSDVFLALTTLLLCIEIIKSTHIGIRTIIDHVLAMVLFVVILIEFLLVKSAGTSTFFLLMVISIVDVLAGFIISVRSATRQVEVDSTGRA